VRTGRLRARADRLGVVLQSATERAHDHLSSSRSHARGQHRSARLALVRESIFGQPRHQTSARSPGSNLETGHRVGRRADEESAVRACASPCEGSCSDAKGSTAAAKTYEKQGEGSRRHPSVLARHREHHCIRIPGRVVGRWRANGHERRPKRSASSRPAAGGWPPRCPRRPASPGAGPAPRSFPNAKRPRDAEREASRTSPRSTFALYAREPGAQRNSGLRHHTPPIAFVVADHGAPRGTSARSVSTKQNCYTASAKRVGLTPTRPAGGGPDRDVVPCRAGGTARGPQPHGQRQGHRGLAARGGSRVVPRRRHHRGRAPTPTRWDSCKEAPRVQSCSRRGQVARTESSGSGSPRRYSARHARRARPNRAAGDADRADHTPYIARSTITARFINHDPGD
jgi:hypothetical protein